MGKLKKRVTLSLYLLISLSIHSMKKIENTTLAGKISKIIQHTNNPKHNAKYNLFKTVHSPDGRYLAFLSAKITPAGKCRLRTITRNNPQANIDLKIDLLNLITSVTKNNFYFYSSDFKKSSASQEKITTLLSLTGLIKKDFDINITIFDTQNGEEILRSKNNSFVFMFSPDSKYLAINNQLIQLKNKNIVKTIKQRKFSAQNHLFGQNFDFYEFSSKSSYLIAGDWFNTHIELFDVKNCKLMTKVNNQIKKLDIADYLFSPDERCLAIRTTNGDLKILEITTGDILFEYSGVQIPHYRFTNNSKYLAVHFNKNGLFQLFDLESETKEKPILEVPQVGSGFWLNPDNKHIAVLQDRKDQTLLLFKDNIEILKLSGVYRAGFSPDEQYLYTEDKHGQLELYSLQDNYKKTVSISMEKFYVHDSIEKEDCYKFIPHCKLLLLYKYKKSGNYYLERVLETQNCKASYFLDLDEIKSFEFDSRKNMHLLSKSLAITSYTLPAKKIAETHNKLSVTLKKKIACDILIKCHDEYL